MSNLAPRSFDDIQADLNRVLCNLTCATSALGKAQDADDRDLAAKARSAINSGVRDLERFQEDLDSWSVSQEHAR